MKGSKLLKVSGILMIIGSIVMIITGIIAVIGVGALALLLGVGTTLLTLSAVLCLVSGICSLIAGIIGVKTAKRSQTATKCIVWGALVAILTILGNILSVSAGSKLDFVSLIAGLALPILYIFGAVKNNKTVS